MILSALYELYDRLVADPEYEIAPPEYSYQKVSFVIVLNPDGSLYEIQDARIAEDGHLSPRRLLVPGGTKKTGSGLNPCFLWDNQAYLLGHDPDKPERARRAFKAFSERHLAVETEIGVSEFRAVCAFLRWWVPERSADYPILKEIGTGFGVFQIRGQTRYVHEHPAVTAWWQEQETGSRNGPVGQCAVTGKVGPIAQLHEPKIKGVAGTQSTGAVIVGFNLSAFESYGKKQSYNVPVSESAAYRYITALNALLDGPKRHKHRLVVGGTTVAFWTERPTPTEDILLPFLGEGSTASESQDETVRAKLEAFFRALRKGSRAYTDLETAPDQTTYFIVGLAPNAARIAVRFFHRDTLAGLIQSLYRHFSDIRVERQWEEGSNRPDPEFPPVQLLLRQTARTDKEIPPVLGGPLLHAIITGSRYPDGLYQAVIRRIVTDRSVNYPRACIIKGYLTRNLRKEVPMSLDRSRPDPAYRLGRLFAVLEKTQADALGNVGATVRDRFYSAASATPASVFPRLLRTYQHHLGKLEGGYKVNREKLVQEILDPLKGFPAHLSLSEQGLFALGYYQQMNDLFRSRAERVEE